MKQDARTGLFIIKNPNEFPSELPIPCCKGVGSARACWAMYEGNGPANIQRFLGKAIL